MALPNVVIVATLSLLALAKGAHIGDAHFGDEQDGLFVAFSEKRIDWVDPSTAKIVHTIESDDFPPYWGDVVYIRSLDHVRHYIFGNDPTNGRVIVIDADTKTVTASIAVGARPVHIYGVERREEVWTHADNDGHFAIIHLSDVENLHYVKADAKYLQAGHGKLKFAASLGDVAYATNTREPGIYELNLNKKGDIVRYVNFTGCPGTHGITMAKNQHLFIECTGGVGTLEYDLVADEVKQIWPSAKGQTYATPDKDFIAAINKGESKVHLWKVGSNGATTSAHKNVNVEGNPDKIAFYPTRSKEGLKDQLLFMAQTRANDDAEGENAFVAGIIMLDMNDVLDWDGVDSNAMPQATHFVLGEVARGSRYTYRPIKRGGQFIATPVNNGLNGENGLGLINAETRKTVGVVEIPGKTGQVLWVPVHTDELRFEVNALAAAAKLANVPQRDIEAVMDIEDLKAQVDTLVIGLAVLGAYAVISLLYFFYVKCIASSPAKSEKGYDNPNMDSVSINLAPQHPE